MVTPLQIIFILIAAATLGSALMVVISRNLVHAALWLIAALFGIAIFYVLLDAGFLAVVQVVIYIGAIAILMIFALMLTRRAVREEGPRYHRGWGWSVLLALLFFIALASILAFWPGVTASPSARVPSPDPLRELGIALVSPDAYVLPFELASVLLLAALVGAIYIAWERREKAR